MNSDDKNINDQELDAAFQEAARNYSPDFQESDWEAMSGLLDKNLPSEPTQNPTGLKKRRLLGLLLALTFVSTIGWFYINSKNNEVAEIKADGVDNSIVINKKENRETGIENKAVNESDIANSVTITEENKLNEGIKENEIYDVNERINSDDLSAKSLVTREKEINNFEQFKNEEAPPQNLVNTSRSESRGGEINDTVNPTSATFLESNKSVSNSKNSQTPLVGRGEVLVNRKEATDSRSQVGFSESTTDNNLVNLNAETTNNSSLVERTFFPNIDLLDAKVVKLQVEIPFGQLPQNNPVSQTASRPDDNASQVFNKGLSLRLTYSPDFSTVNTDFFEVGNNSAFLAEYRFNNRFVVQSGVIRSLKKYSALPGDYQWPEAWGIMPDNLASISAFCDMLDIPLNIRFDLSQKKNSRLFVNAGITNYLMLNELYEYNYYTPSGGRAEWEGKTGFYAFGVVNLSAGFEKSISRKISFQVEPFVKVPVRELGFGNVRLTTLGIFASAKIKL